mgnify:FL=1|jgi:nuclease
MYNIFISHAWKYNSEYYNLEEMLNNAPYFTWKNYSVPQHDALDTKTDRELEEALKRQISPCSCVLIIAGMYYNYRTWIQKEIDIAKTYKKPIIVVRPRGQERMPSELLSDDFYRVNWSTNSIVEAVRNYSL